jgi:hypothetical protein
MVCKIIINEKNKSSCQKYEDDTGLFFDISGQINFISNESIINCDTTFLIRDVFSLFYSINDFFEFGFASISLGKENITFGIEKNEDNTAIVEFNDEKIEVETKSFLSSVLKNSYDFFNKLNQHQENKEYRMYLHIIHNLYKRFMPEKIEEIEGHKNPPKKW